jgi:hypothetical protein
LVESAALWLLKCSRMQTGLVPLQGALCVECQSSRWTSAAAVAAAAGKSCQLNGGSGADKTFNRCKKPGVHHSQDAEPHSSVV